jgi:hypothetical protein
MAAVIGVAVILAPAAAWAENTPSLPALQAMNDQQLRDYAKKNSINLGDAVAHDTMVTLIYEAEVNKIVGAKAQTNPTPGGFSFELPSAEQFRPHVPDLRSDGVASRGWNVYLIIIGFIGMAILGYGVVQALILAGAILGGKLALKQIGERLLNLAIGLGLTLFVFGGAIVGTVSAVVEFLRYAAVKG